MADSGYETCTVCGDVIHHGDHRVDDRHEWCTRKAPSPSIAEKAEEVLAHVRKKRLYSVSPEEIFEADLVIGDRNDNTNKYDILKCRYKRKATDQMSQSSTVVPSTKELHLLFRNLTQAHGALHIVWARLR